MDLRHLVETSDVGLTVDLRHVVLFTDIYIVTVGRSTLNFVIKKSVLCKDVINIPGSTVLCPLVRGRVKCLDTGTVVVTVTDTVDVA